MRSDDPASDPIDRSADRRAFRDVRRLTGAYVALSGLGLLTTVLLRHHADDVNSSVWTRASILLVVSCITHLVAVRASRGSARALLRLRILTALQLVAIVAIVVLPGPFPLWSKIGQAACGALLLGVVAIVNGPRLRPGVARG